jgi:hypothetical protein
MARIRQRLSSEHVGDLNKAIIEQFAKPEISDKIEPGSRIALLVGSRGIARVSEIVSLVVRQLKALGANPFIVPAMGSHGAATAEGQVEVLASLGVTEDQVGAPVISSMETVELGLTGSGISVFFDRNAANADGIIPIARIKPHTVLRHRFESGIIKMLTIGAGKQRGADELHSRFSVAGFGPLLYESYLHICGKLPVLCGIGIVENGHEQPAVIEAVPQRMIEHREPELLQKAFGMMPRIPFNHFDVLIVDQLGKNISGDGMDPNVTGRYAVDIKSDINYQRLVALDLTPETHGNALGIGMADVTTRRLVSQIDYVKAYMNAFTSKIVLATVKVPMTVDSDREAIATALKTCVCVNPGQHKVVRIKNTLQLAEMEISETLLAEARAIDHVEIIGDPEDMQFDDEGTLRRF